MLKIIWLQKKLTRAESSQSASSQGTVGKIQPGGFTFQRRVPRERDDTPPKTHLRKDTSKSEEGSPPARTRRAPQPRRLFFESSDDEDNPTGVGTVSSDFGELLATGAVTVHIPASRLKEIS